MIWDHHKGLFRFESSDRTMSPPAGAFGLTIDGRLTVGFTAECYDDNPEPVDTFAGGGAAPLTAAEREEIAQAMIARWLKWMFTDGFPGSCPAERHLDAIRVPGINRPLCTCAQDDGSGMSPETSRLLQKGLVDALAGAVTPIPVETTE